MEQGSLNEAWGHALIDALALQGVKLFCHCPGKRNSPLALGVAKHPRVTTIVHFDERGAAFHALGYAKATKQPAAVIVTSGTALGNLMPAVMEASMSHIPLLLLTCDRGAELHGTMANQTCDQIKIFGDYVREYLHMPLPNTQIPKGFLARTIAQAVSSSLYPLPGPVQINIPLAEPLFSNTFEAYPSEEVQVIHPEKPVLADPSLWINELSKVEKGAIVLGGNANAPSANSLSEKLGWPIFADIISGFRENGNGNSIPHYHHLLENLPDSEVETILHLGDAVVSKTLLEWMQKAKKVIHIASHGKRCDPLHLVDVRLICSPEWFCVAVASSLPDKKSRWIDEWIELGKLAKNSYDFPALSEPHLFHWLQGKQSAERALFIGNSMPIRDADMFFFPTKNMGPIFANRGLSGIDGNIATIAGIAQVIPVTAVIGDQTALHDLNSLALLKETKHRVTLYIINNSGGGIFSFVETRTRPKELDRYFAAAHNRSFAHAADLFDLSYTLAKDEKDLDANSTIIEIQTNREANWELHQNLRKDCQMIIQSFSSTVS